MCCASQDYSNLMERLQHRFRRADRPVSHVQGDPQTARIRQPRLRADPCGRGHIGIELLGPGGLRQRGGNALLWAEAFRRPRLYRLPSAPHSVNVYEKPTVRELWQNCVNTPGAGRLGRGYLNLNQRRLTRMPYSGFANARRWQGSSPLKAPSPPSHGEGAARSAAAQHSRCEAPAR